MFKCALIGNPNCGKTTLFNSLTGSTAHVGNWPGVTVEKRSGEYKKGEVALEIVDLPGIYSLSPYTPEEVISREFVLDEKPDCIISVVDATNLERNLYLTTQVMEIDLPIVVALNFTDVLEKNGDKIDIKKLEEKLSLPVVSISALKSRGLDELMSRAYEVSKSERKGETVLEGGALYHLIRDCKIALEGQGVENALFHAVKLVELDELEVKNHPVSAEMVEKFKATVTSEESDFEGVIADARYKFIVKNCSPALTKNKNYHSGSLSKSDKIDKVLTHKFFGIPIFLVIMFAIFHLTFSENFLYIGMALPEGWVSLEGTVYEGLFGSEGIASPGVLLMNFVSMSCDLLTGTISTAMINGGVAEWLIGLVCDGVLGGLFAILGFLPQILVLFMFFSILEDSGYMARVAFMLDRIFRKFGLSGRAFMPMIMGFGCSVPATINTRTLADENERISTIRVIPFFSCGAKLPILTAIAGGIGVAFNLPHTDLITYGMYLLGIVVAIISVLLMRSTTLKGEIPPFIMELPAYHLPQGKNLAKHLWDKAKHFIQKAFTVILLSTVVIWVISHFSFGWEFLPDERINDSILAGIGQLIQPLFTPLGFGSQLNSYGWVFAVAAITGLIAKENVIATFGTLAACIVGAVIDVETDGGISAVSEMIRATGITVPALVSFIAFNMLTIPCFAAVATARAELPTKKKFYYTLVFWITTSYLTSTAVYLIGSWWWTVFVFLGVIAVAITVVTLSNKGIIRLPKIEPKRKKKRVSSCNCGGCPYSSKCGDNKCSGNRK